MAQAIAQDDALGAFEARMAARLEAFEARMAALEAREWDHVTPGGA